MEHNAPDANSLAAQLADGGVAFAADNPANNSLRQDLEAALSDTVATGIGRAGVVVLEQADVPPAQLRDLAQDVHALTDLETVIVRSPAATAAVSDRLTRAEVEKAQYALISKPDYADGVRAFGAEADNFTVPWVMVAGTILFIAALAAAVSMRAGRQ